MPINSSLHKNNESFALMGSLFLIPPLVALIAMALSFLGFDVIRVYVVESFLLRLSDGMLMLNFVLFPIVALALGIIGRKHAGYARGFSTAIIVTSVVILFLTAFAALRPS